MLSKRHLASGWQPGLPLGLKRGTLRHIATADLRTAAPASLPGLLLSPSPIVGSGV